MRENYRRRGMLASTAAALGLVLALSGPAVAVTADALERLGLEPIDSALAAPDFTIPILEGGSMSLAEHRGHVVVLNFWTTW